MLFEKLMNLTPEEQVEANQHHERFFPVRPVRASGRPKVLARREDRALSAAAETFLKDNHARGLVILKDGEIVAERYGAGFHERSRVIAWSITKSFVSTLVGAALKDGAIASLNDSMTKYLPQIKGSGYDGVSIHHCLQMSSGALWSDAYLDATSSIYQLFNGFERRQAGWTLKFMSGLRRAAPPGTVFCYNTGETCLLGLLVAAATGKVLSAYLEEKIWHPAGMEADGQFNLESEGGFELGGGGLSSCLRDWARFGLFFLAGGKGEGKDYLPDGWMLRAAHPGESDAHLQVGCLEAPNILGYGYQWWSFAKDGGEWPAHNGAFTGQGIFGQFLYLNPKERLVAAICSTWESPWEVERERRAYDFLSDVVKHLS